MSTRLDFGSREYANEFRDQFDLDDDRRRKAVDLSQAELSAEEVMDLQGAAAEARLDRAAGAGMAELTEAEKSMLDFSEINYFAARSAKATLQSQGIEDWVSAVDSSLTIDEIKSLHGTEAERGMLRTMHDMGRGATVGKSPVRDPDHARERGVEDPTDAMRARGYQRTQGELEEHAISGARKGSEEAKQLLRQRGWSSTEIREIVATGQTRAALTPGSVVRLSTGHKVTPREWAKAKRSHEHRRVEAQNADEARRAPITTDYERWRANMNRLDYPGVDTREPRSHFVPDDREEEFRRKTDELWKWQRRGPRRR